MNVLLSGATGLIGSACVEELQRAGHVVRPLLRGKTWEVESGRVDLASFQPDAVIHLAGANIASRWTENRKKEIWTSRVDATRKLCEYFAESPHPLRVFLSGSAVGFYGLQGDKWLNEKSPGSKGFLAELCAAWEAATEPLAATGCRIAHLRTGIVLSPKGGALAKMLTPFRFGLGGPFDDGGHWMSWITLDDQVRAIQFLLENAHASGPINLVAPNPVTNAEFSQTLGHVLRRPAFLRTPSAALRLVYGEFVDEALLASQRVKPSALESLGFEWKHPELAEALRFMLQKP